MSDDTSQRKRQTGRGRASARSVSDILDGVLEPLIARRTGMRLDLIRIWSELVGAEFANTTRPEQIKWARRAHEADAFEPAMLVVACEPASALFFQHEQSNVINRVNEFFGFEAVNRVRILQKPVLEQDAHTSVSSLQGLTTEEQARLQTMLDEIDDPQLRERLASLGQGILGKSRKKR